nr:MAG TPA: hypothetical protein [Caudoviricetes sp.]
MAIDKAIDSTAFDSKLTSVADAIRSKSGKTATMTLNQMPQEISALNVANVAPFTEILTGTVTFNTSATTWALPKSENLLAGYLICTDYWNVQDDIPGSIQQLFFTSKKSFGYFSNAAAVASSGGVRRDVWVIESNTTSVSIINVQNGAVNLMTSLSMSFLGTYWYCLIYGVKS